MLIFKKLLACTLVFLPLAASAQTLTVLHSFSGSDGSGPVAGVVFGPGGSLYGTTIDGGSKDDGAIFRVTTGGEYKLLHSFAGTDGSQPWGPMLYAKDGNLYGMTLTGGSANQGVIYEVSAAGAFSVVHNFTGFEGSDAYGGLMQATNGNGYGFTSGGGKNGFGTVFRITPSGQYTVIYNFNASDGAYPDGTPIDLKNGLYAGTTRRGGADDAGTAFAVSDAGQITSFSGSGSFNQPYAGIVEGPGGIFYGTTYGGGDGYGSIYSINSDLAFTNLASFSLGGPSFPIAGLTIGTDGDLYGATLGGSAVIKITPQSNLTTVFSFDGTNGETLGGNMVQGADYAPGSMTFYGTANAGGANGDGEVFRLVLPPAN